jgi:hypothetical protein
MGSAHELFTVLSIAYCIDEQHGAWSVKLPQYGSTLRLSTFFVNTPKPWRKTHGRGVDLHEQESSPREKPKSNAASKFLAPGEGIASPVSRDFPTCLTLVDEAEVGHFSSVLGASISTGFCSYSATMSMSLPYIANPVDPERQRPRLIPFTATWNESPLEHLMELPLPVETLDTATASFKADTIPLIDGIASKSVHFTNGTAKLSSLKRLRDV